VTFVKSLTEKRIVFRCFGICTETEDTLYITLPAFLKRVYRDRDLLLYCINEELFYGTENECFNHFIDEIRGIIFEIKTTVMDTMINGTTLSIEKRPRRMLTELLTEHEKRQIALLKERKTSLKNILTLRKTLYERLLDTWKNHLD